MALQLECETRDPAVSVVGPLPPELHAWLDGDVAVSARSADPKAAAAFVAYIMRAAAAPVWKANGLERAS
jgi:ABC-type molybdate transport system substrate-binding protein